jgi:hypothetical protein
VQLHQLRHIRISCQTAIPDERFHGVIPQQAGIGLGKMAGTLTLLFDGVTSHQKKRQYSDHEQRTYYTLFMKIHLPSWLLPIMITMRFVENLYLDLMHPHPALGAEAA